AGDPVAFLSRFAGWMFWIALFAGGMTNLVIFPVLIVADVVITGFSFHPVAIGVAAGVVFGIVTGKVLCLNYLTLIAETKLELRRRATREGKRLGWIERIKRWARLLLLYSVPFMMMYEMVRSFRPEIDLGRMAREMTGISLGRYALVLAALGL